MAKVETVEETRGKVTFVLASSGACTLRFRLPIEGLTVAEAIKWLKPRFKGQEKEGIYGFTGPYMVRKRGKGQPENEYQEVPEDSDLVLTGDHILKARG